MYLIIRDTLEYASRERDQQKPAIKTVLRFLINITEENMKRAIWRIFKISQWPQMLAIGLIRQFQYVYRDSDTIEGSILADLKPAISCFSEDFMYCLALSLCVYFYLRVKEICRSQVDLLAFEWKKKYIIKNRVLYFFFLGVT